MRRRDQPVELEDAVEKARPGAKVTKYAAMSAARSTKPARKTSAAPDRVADAQTLSRVTNGNATAANAIEMMSSIVLSETQNAMPRMTPMAKMRAA